MNRESLTKSRPASYSKSYMTADWCGICKVTTVEQPTSFWKQV